MSGARITSSAPHFELRLNRPRSCSWGTNDLTTASPYSTNIQSIQAPYLIDEMDATSAVRMETTKTDIRPAGNASLQLHGELGSRQRSTIACLECRMRKVRCDISLKGGSCTNCRSNARKCSTKRRTRRAKFERPIEGLLSIPPISMKAPDEQSSVAGDYTPARDLEHKPQTVEPLSSLGQDLNGWTCPLATSLSEDTQNAEDARDVCLGANDCDTLSPTGMILLFALSLLIET